MIGIGFIGSGGVAERHALALQELRGAELRAVWSRTPASTADFARRHSARADDSLAALLADPGIDAVFVLTPAENHFDHASRALQAGKHVLQEKPVSRSVAEIRALSAIAEATGKICMPSHNYIYAPEVQRLRHHLHQGRLGRLQSFWMLCNQRQTQAMGQPGMVLNDMMIHLAYSSLFFCGKPTRLCAFGSNVFFESGADDQIGITLGYGDGTIGHLWASWATEDLSRDPWSTTIKVFGAAGTGVASWDSVKNADQPQPGWDDGAYWDSFLNVQRHFVENCLGQGEPPLSDLNDAASAATIIEAATLSLAEQRWVTLS